MIILVRCLWRLQLRRVWASVDGEGLTLQYILPSPFSAIALHIYVAIALLKGNAASTTVLFNILQQL